MSDDKDYGEQFGITTDEDGMRWGIPSDAMHIFISRYVSKDPHVAIYAIKAIREVAEIGYPIPEALLPYLNQACDAWVEKQGNTVSNFETEDVWRLRIWDAHALVLGGYSPKKAFDAIAERDGVKSSSVKSHYYTDQVHVKSKIERHINECEQANANRKSRGGGYSVPPSTDPEIILHPSNKR